LHHYLGGHKVTINPGWWPIVLEAANNDPLRAQEIEANLSRDWWEKYLVYRQEQAEIAKAQERKGRR
jgi:hypothetical protein